uniref:AMP-binding enzyme C-terminal domain-containing protein n=1 Tax=Megaselia scalaris TaxID=36166 RepID=T1GAU3_MEGSC
MKSKGFHVSPSEIESLIVKIPEVQEVSVCGIPDVMTINLPAALVVKKQGTMLSEDTVKDYVAERMPHFKHLSGGVYFVDSLPRTASGKVIRKMVQEHAVKHYRSHGRMCLLKVEV